MRTGLNKRKRTKAPGRKPRARTVKLEADIAGQILEVLGTLTKPQGACIPKVRIERQTDAQLADAIKQAQRVEPNFWAICYGIHAFFEQRRRKQKARRREVELDVLDFDNDRMWGQD